jgi:hypothetical protein
MLAGLSAFFVGEGILPSVTGTIELHDCEARQTAGPGLLVVKKDARSVQLVASNLKLVNTASKRWPSGGATAYQSPITIISVRHIHTLTYLLT